MRGQGDDRHALLPPDELERVGVLFDRGWQVEIHAIGDGAVRMSLDALERAATVNPVPPRGRRHRLEHIETVDPADIPRFGRSASSPRNPSTARPSRAR